jgi:uncharacterized membrane protein YgdD (TMEM256/DUF423 family)
MPQFWIGTGACCCALAIVAGAFGAHGLKARLDPPALILWETAARYFIYGGFGLILLGLSSGQLGRGFSAAGTSILLGMIIFSGTVAALALGAPRWFGAVTPIGGLLLVVGFLLFAWGALRPG